MLLQTEKNTARSQLRSSTDSGNISLLLENGRIDADLQAELQDARFIAKFMVGISASLDPDGVCSIAARLLYERVPYQSLKITLSSQPAGSKFVYAPARGRRSRGATVKLQVLSGGESKRSGQDASVSQSLTETQPCGHVYDLPGDIGTLEFMVDDIMDQSFPDSLMSEVSTHLARILGNTLEYSRVRELSMRDSLTGLYNRRVFDEMMAVESVRQNMLPLSLLLIDLDNFKLVNDTFGHPAGDQVLAAFGRILRESCRGSDVVARYGGEEFAVLIPESSTSKAHEIARRLMTRFSALVFVFDEKRISLTISVGIACSNDNEIIPMDELMRRSDNALYQAKAWGKNRICFHETGTFVGA